MTAKSKIVKRLEASVAAPPKVYAFCVRASDFMHQVLIERYELIKWSPKTVQFRDQFSDKKELQRVEGTHSHAWFKTYAEAQVFASATVDARISEHEEAVQKYRLAEKVIASGKFRAHNPRSPVIGKFKI